MTTGRKKVEAGLKKARVAAAVATVAGKKAARKLALAGDDALVRLGEAARRRQRARQGKAMLRTVGKAALVTGVVVATRAVMKKRQARGR